MFQKFGNIGLKAKASWTSWLQSPDTAGVSAIPAPEWNAHEAGNCSSTTSADNQQRAADVLLAWPMSASRSPSGSLPIMDNRADGSQQSRGKRKAELTAELDGTQANTGHIKTSRRKVDNRVFWIDAKGKNIYPKELSDMPPIIQKIAQSMAQGTPTATQTETALVHSSLRMGADRRQYAGWQPRAPSWQSRYRPLSNRLWVEDDAPELEECEEGESGDPATLALPPAACGSTQPTAALTDIAAAAGTNTAEPSSPSKTEWAQSTNFSFPGQSGKGEESCKAGLTPPSIKAMRRGTSKANLSQLAQEPCSTGLTPTSDFTFGTTKQTSQPGISATTAHFPGSHDSQFTAMSSQPNAGPTTSLAIPSLPTQPTQSKPATVISPGLPGASFSWGSAQTAASNVPGFGTGSALGSSRETPASQSASAVRTPEAGASFSFESNVQPAASAAPLASFSFGSNAQPAASAALPATSSSPGTGFGQISNPGSVPANPGSSSTPIAGSSALVPANKGFVFGPAATKAASIPGPMPSGTASAGVGPKLEPSPFTNATAAASANPFSSGSAPAFGAQSEVANPFSSTTGATTANPFGSSTAPAFNAGSGASVNPFSNNSAALAGKSPGAAAGGFNFGSSASPTSGVGASNPFAQAFTPAFGNPAAVPGSNASQSSMFFMGGPQSTPAQGTFAPSNVTMAFGSSVGSAAAPMGASQPGKFAFGSSAALAMSHPSSSSGPLGGAGTPGAFGFGIGQTGSAFGNGGNTFAGSQPVPANPFGSSQQPSGNASGFAFGQPATGAQSASALGIPQSAPAFGTMPGAGMTMGGTGGMPARRRVHIRRK